MPRVAQELSPEAHRVMVRGLREGLTSRMIAGRIAQECGEKVSERTVARRAAEWRADQARLRGKQEDVAALVAAMKQQDFTAEEMISALALQALMADPEKFAAADVMDVQDRNLAAREVAIKQQKLELQSRQVALQERRVKLLEERERRAMAALEEKDETMTPEDRVRRIREIYGLAN